MFLCTHHTHQARPWEKAGHGAGGPLPPGVTLPWSWVVLVQPVQGPRRVDPLGSPLPCWWAWKEGAARSPPKRWREGMSPREGSLY